MSNPWKPLKTGKEIGKELAEKSLATLRKALKLPKGGDMAGTLGYKYLISGRLEGNPRHTEYKGVVEAPTPKMAILLAFVKEFESENLSKIRSPADVVTALKSWHGDKEDLEAQIKELADDDTSWFLQTGDHTYDIEVDEDDVERVKPDRDPCIPVDRAVHKLLRKFFCDNFDSATIWDGYCESNELIEFRSMKRTIAKVKKDPVLKLAVRYRLIKKGWIDDLVTQLEDMEEYSLK